MFTDTSTITRNRPYELPHLLHRHLKTLHTTYAHFRPYLDTRFPKDQKLTSYERLYHKLIDYRVHFTDHISDYLTRYTLEYSLPHTEAEAEARDILLVSLKDEIKEWHFRLREFLGWLNDAAHPERREDRALVDRMLGIDPGRRERRRGGERRTEVYFQGLVMKELGVLLGVLEGQGNRAEGLVKQVDRWYRRVGKTFIYKKDGWYLGPECWEQGGRGLEDAGEERIDALIPRDSHRVGLAV